MKLKFNRSTFRIMIATVIVLFVPFVFFMFRFLFASCYIDDGCGRIDPFVPFIVTLSALASSLISGFVIALITNFFHSR